MPRKARAYVAALPLSALPEWREFLSPFLGGAGQRSQVVMMRLSHEAVQRLDELVEAGLFASRSEAAAFLVGAGTQAQKELFAKIARRSAEIKRLRQIIRRTALEALRGSGRGQRPRGARG